MGSGAPSGVAGNRIRSAPRCFRTPGGGTHATESQKILQNPKSSNIKVRIRIMEIQTTKKCSRCQKIKATSLFNRRALSRDGYAAACSECTSNDKWMKYREDPNERRKTIARASSTRAARFERDPAYKRAFWLWGAIKARGSKIPPWVHITDFVPICQAAIDAGPGYELDHIIPIKGKLVCGLHVPSNVRVVTTRENQAKRNKYEPIL